MIDSIPVDWLFNQHVPLIYFIIALLTRPAMWAKTVSSFCLEKMSQFNKNEKT